MASPLDKLLSSAGSSPSGREATHTRALLEEALKHKPPSRPWHLEWRNTLLSALLLVVLSAAMLLLSGNTTWSWIWARMPSLLLLASSGGFCAWAALSPRALRYRPFSLGVWLLAMVGVVLLRGNDEPPSVTPWVCTLGHVGMGVIPLWVAVGALRNVAPGRWRWLLAGVFVGTTGAMGGELGCVGGMTHIALYHLAAWWAMAVVAFVLSFFLKSKTYAP